MAATITVVRPTQSGVFQLVGFHKLPSQGEAVAKLATYKGVKSHELVGSTHHYRVVQK